MTPAKQRPLCRHTDSVTSLALSPDGTTLASGSADTNVMFWNPATGRLQRTLDGLRDTVLCRAFQPPRP